ncbi:hypothetical protein KI387_041186, partial [Taxus chinensis]
VRGGREKLILPKEEEKRLTAERDSSGQEYDVKYANRPDRPKWEQIVRKQLGHLGRDDANRPAHPKQRKSYWDIRDEGTRGTGGSAEGVPESQSNNATCHLGQMRDEEAQFRRIR